MGEGEAVRTKTVGEDGGVTYCIANPQLLFYLLRTNWRVRRYCSSDKNKSYRLLIIKEHLITFRFNRWWHPALISSYSFLHHLFRNGFWHAENRLIFRLLSHFIYANLACSKDEDALGDLKFFCAFHIKHLNFLP